MSTAAITNEHLLVTIEQLTQVVRDGFTQVNERMDRLEQRMDQLEERMTQLEGRMDQLEWRVSAIENRLSEHDLQFAQIKAVLHSMEDNHAAYISDIEDILDRIQVLENRIPDLTAQEVRDFKQQLHKLSDWARKVAKITKVPLQSM